jgi:primosomal protein N' (replication factor Y)
MSSIEKTPASQPVAVSVVVALPSHAGLGAELSYLSAQPLPAGTLVRVPLGTREVLGVVWDTAPHTPDPDPNWRGVLEVLDGPAPLGADWRRLLAFAARYYQRSLGEVTLAALPPSLRELTAAQWQRRLRKLDKRVAQAPEDTPQPAPAPVPQPSPQQHVVLQALAQPDAQTRPVLLHGVTGSGKTEVYLQAVSRLLTAHPDAQALVLVPEINLTPQLMGRFIDRFGPHDVVALHSGMTPAQRLDSWLLAHQGHARIVLGTRTAVLCSLPGLQLIVVDEEHDPSYKSQEGARYSARDLAIYRARALQQAGTPCQVILGSATPSLESWHAAEQGRYLRLDMPARQGDGALAALRLIDMGRQPKGAVLAPALVDAITERAQRGEQTLLLLNRRGYAPVLSCHACGWKSHCPHCSAYRVFHKIDRTLRCHHCGHSSRVPHACPDCGNLDIAPVGKGTQQLEEQVSALLAGVSGPHGRALRVARMDADTTRTKGSLEEQLDRVHRGEVDVLVGTQMVAKGHDFRRITLVAVLNADSALFASDYRAPERLFALLMQAAGRAGRDAALSGRSEMWVQTWHPQHTVFKALAKHDFAGFARAELAERELAGLPPHVHQALLRAEARSQEAAQAFLSAVRATVATLEGAEHLTVYPPITPTIQRVANVERAQMLLESPSRPALQHVLAQLPPHLAQARSLPEAKGLIRWAVDVDPLGI